MRKFSTCMCARVPSTVRHRFGFKWQRGKHVVGGFVLAQEAEFHLPFHDFDSFHASFRTFVCIQCTKCQECRKTYYCVVVQGMRWRFCFVSCHEWSILGVRFWSRSCGLCVRCTFFDSVFVSQPSAICVSEPRSVSRGFPVQTRTRAPLLIQHSDSGFQCYCDEVSPNRQHWAEIFPSLGCLWRNWRENPHFSFFFIGRNSLSILCPSLTPSCPTPAVIEVPCMRKTEQQPSAWTIFAQLDFFLSFLQCFSSFAHRKSKGSPIYDVISKHTFCQDTNKLILGVFPPWR